MEIQAAKRLHAVSREHKEFAAEVEAKCAKLLPAAIKTDGDAHAKLKALGESVTAAFVKKYPNFGYDVHEGSKRNTLEIGFGRDTVNGVSFQFKLIQTIEPAFTKRVW